MNLKQNYLIHYGSTQRLGDESSIIDIKNRFELEFKNGWILLRDRTQRLKAACGFQSIPAPKVHQDVRVQLQDGTWTLIRGLPRAHPPELQVASKLRIDPLPKAVPLPEERLIQQSLKKISVVIISICILFEIMTITEKTDTPDEKLIPKKFAKLILSKPIEKSASISKSGAAVSKSFRSKSVQKNLKSILQGGLSRYSILETGKSIREMSQRMNQNGKQLITSLGQQTDRAIGSLSSGGGKSGIGTSIQGQGTGQLEIGLNFQDASVEEGLTREEVAKVIHGHLKEIRYCYESAILNDPSLAGKVLIDFKIGSKGSVDSAHTSENTMNTSLVGSCLVTKLRGWKFPSPRGGVQVAVTYPFLFKSVNR